MGKMLITRTITLRHVEMEQEGGLAGTEMVAVWWCEKVRTACCLPGYLRGVDIRETHGFEVQSPLGPLLCGGPKSPGLNRTSSGGQRFLCLLACPTALAAARPAIGSTICLIYFF